MGCAAGSRGPRAIWTRHREFPDPIGNGENHYPALEYAHSARVRLLGVMLDISLAPAVLERVKALVGASEDDIRRRGGTPPCVLPQDGVGTRGGGRCRRRGRDGDCDHTPDGGFGASAAGSSPRQPRRRPRRG